MPDIDTATSDSPTLEIATGEPPAIDIDAPTVPPLNIETVTVSVPGPQGVPGPIGPQGPAGENGKAVITWELIHSNDDVNRQKYLTAGYYSVRSYAESRTIANLPTQEGTSNKVVGWLEVRNLTPGQIPGVHAWAYAMQEMTGIDGKLYRRMIRSEGNPKQVIYGAWARG